MDTLKNIVELIDRAYELYSNNTAIQIRNKESYDKISYKTLVEDIRAMAAAFVKRGLIGKHISVIGENSYEWNVSYFGAIYSGNVIVPIDRDLPSNEISALIGMSDISLMVYSSSYDETIESMIEDHPNIEFVKITKHLKSGSFLDLIEQGKEVIKQEGIKKSDPDPKAMCEIVLTSGTTGVSKGVMLSHNNILTNVYACYKLFIFKGTILSMLPMHHALESTLSNVYSMYLGTSISINNSIKYIAQNLQIFKPTAFLVVPLIIETIYNNIWEKIRKSGKEKTVRRMISISRFLLKCGIDVRRLFFKKITSAFGGKLDGVFCGGAPLDKNVAIGLYDFGISIYIGYGITECAPLITANVALSPAKYHTCGKAIACNEIKLIDINENGEGEVCAKGTNIMLGYYKNPKATAEVMEDGWYKTGDIGTIDKDGFLTITGRKKNIIILNNGKNVYPEEVESYIYKIKFIKECVVSDVSSTIQAEIFLNQDLIEETKTENAEELVRTEIEKVNDTLAYYKRIAIVKFRDVEFPKTTSKKIKRYK